MIYVHLSRNFFVALQYFEKVCVCDFVVLYLCCFCSVVAAFICMTYFTTYCCHYKLTDLWTVCMYVCVCMYGHILNIFK
jgi:hypothetical protein